MGTDQCFPTKINMKNDPKWVGLAGFCASDLCQALKDQCRVTILSFKARTHLRMEGGCRHYLLCRFLNSRAVLSMWAS